MFLFEKKKSKKTDRTNLLKHIAVFVGVVAALKVAPIVIRKIRSARN